MRKLSCEGERLTDPLERLVRVTEEPEAKCLVAKANYAIILTVGAHLTAVLAAIIDPEALLDMLLYRSQQFFVNLWAQFKWCGSL